MTDDVHFVDLFRPDGVLITKGMGRTVIAKWRVEDDRLCLERDLDPGTRLLSGLDGSQHGCLAAAGY